MVSLGLYSKVVLLNHAPVEITVYNKELKYPL